MQFEQILPRIALAFGIGLLIGLERGWARRAALPGSRTAGVRTFAISGLLGGVAGALALGEDGRVSVGGAVVLAAVFIAYAATIATFSRDENQATGTNSATTAVAMLLTFLLGAYALIGDMHVAAAAAVAAAGVLVI